MLAHALKGMTPLRIAHGCPLDPADLYTQGSTILEQCSINLKIQVHMLQAWRPVLDEGASAHTDLWPDLCPTYSNPDIYFEASALLEGEQNFALLSMNSEQAVTPKTFSFLSWSLALPPPDTLECDLKPGEGADHGQHDTAHLKPKEPKQHDAMQYSICLKKSEHVAKDPDKAGGV